MTQREVLDRIIGPSCTLMDVIDAFSGGHATFSGYTWSAEARLHGEIVCIEGIIFDGDAEIGHFSRRLGYWKGSAHAIHEIMEVHRPQRDRGIAKAHYTGLLRFYERVGIRYVTMDAEGEGPVVWPAFGFYLTRRKHREMLLKILKEWGLLAAARYTLTEDTMTSKKHDFKYPLEKRPVRFSPNAAEAATKTFGDVQYTIGKPPKPPEIVNKKVEVGLA